jgi:hypothetical protein
MLNHVQLRDFKPDVVICPHCTQHLMGVKDVQWAADRVSFTYGCAGCGHEIDRPVGDDVVPAALSSAKALNQALKTDEPAEDVTLMDDLGPFPFRKPRENSSLFTFEADDTVDDKAATDDDSAAADDMTEEHSEPAPFGSMLLLPPKPWVDTRVDTRLDAPVFARRAGSVERPALTPKQVFDTERRDNELHDGPSLDPAVTTRASALLRDVSIFSL